MVKNNKTYAFEFADNIISFSFIITLLLSAAGILLSPLILHFTRFRTEGYDFAIFSLRFMLPIMIFYSLNYIFQGLLQSLGKFSMPALISIPSSMIIILYVIFLGKTWGIKGLVIATFIALSSQAVILIPPLLRTEYRYKPKLDIHNKDIRGSLKLIPPVIIATSAYQINMLFNITLSANFKDSVAIISLCQNLILSAILAFIYSMTSVLFPKFSMLAAENRMVDFKKSLIDTLKVILFILVPFSIGLISLRYETIDLLYGWGKFSKTNVGFASIILSLYSIGIIGIGIKEVLDRIFYSLKDTSFPAINGVIIVLTNICVSLLLTKHIGVYGIPLAYSISTLLGSVIALLLLYKKIGSIFDRFFIIFLIKIVIASLLMFISIKISLVVVTSFTLGSKIISKLITILVPTCTALLVYFLSAFILKIDIFYNFLGNKMKHNKLQ